MRAFVAVLLGAIALSGCSSVGGTDGKGYISGNGQVSTIDAADREEPVELTGTDLNGNEVDLASLRGKPVVVNVWWSECPPCIAEMPDLQGAHEELGDRAGWVGINIRDNAVEKAQLFETTYDVSWPSIYDPTGRALLPFSGRLSPRNIPSTVVLDPQGRLAALVLGPIPSQGTLVGLVEDVEADHG